MPIASLDDFHPDQLVENLEVFEQLLDLRRNLQSKAGFDRAAKEVLSWSGEEALPAAREKAARLGGADRPQAVRFRPADRAAGAGARPRPTI